MLLCSSKIGSLLDPGSISTFFVNASDFGMGKDKGLKISLCIQEDVKRSPFQVGIEAARQLGSCIFVGIMAAALMVGCVSVPIDGVSRLCYVLLIQVFMCVTEGLGALAAAAWDLVAATLFAAAAFPRAIQGFLSLVFRQFVIVGDFIFAFVGWLLRRFATMTRGLGSPLSRKGDTTGGRGRDPVWYQLGVLSFTPCSCTHWSDVGGTVVLL